MKLIPWLLALLLCGCVSDQVASDSLDEIAKDYVQMQLEIGEREPGYVDAYYGPKEWAEAAKAAPRSLPALVKEAMALTARTNAVDPAELDPLSIRRRAFLLAQLWAASTRLRMAQGEKLSFAGSTALVRAVSAVASLTSAGSERGAALAASAHSLGP